MVKTVTVQEYSVRIRYDDEARRDEVKRALYKAALRGEVLLVEATPVDKGEAKNAWTTVPTDDGAETFNDAPHAGILELGSRPHRPPLEPILRWVVRKFSTGKKSFDDWNEIPKELFGIALSVVRSIEEHGTKPHYMVRNNLERLTRITKREVERALGGTE